MIVKICGITNRDDAIAAAEAGASAIGFNFYRLSPRYISPTGASLIAEELPPGIVKVGVFVNETDEGVARISLQAGLDVAQLHGASDALGIRIWLARPASEARAPFLEPPGMEALLLDAPSNGFYGGTGQSFRWPEARGLAQRVIIAGGLDAENVRQAIEEARPWGVDACSRLEREPGLKDRGEMRRFIAAARAAFENERI